MAFGIAKYHHQSLGSPHTSWAEVLPAKLRLTTIHLTGPKDMMIIIMRQRRRDAQASGHASTLLLSFHVPCVIYARYFTPLGSKAVGRRRPTGLENKLFK